MKANPQGSLWRSALAAVLACGLMWPAVALAANDQSSETPPPVLTEPIDWIAKPLVSAASNSLAAPSSDGTALPAAASTQADVGRAAADPSGSLITVGAPDTEGWYTAGGFKVKGGTPGDQNSGDWYLAFAQGNSGSRILHIRSSTHLTIKTEATTTDTVRIEPGAAAWLTLAGVDIAPDATAWTPPINLVTNISETTTGDPATWDGEITRKTSLHLTLADGTQNTLTANAGKYTPGIRCGWGSTLTIDDGLYPVDDDGRPTSPKLEKGKLAQDTMLSDGSVAQKGNPAGCLDAAYPGKLAVTGTWYTPGIGQRRLRELRHHGLQRGRHTNAGRAH